MASPPSHLITVHLAAAVTGPGVTPELLFELIDNSDLPAYYIDKTIKVRLHDVNTALSNTTSRSDTPTTPLL